MAGVELHLDHGHAQRGHGNSVATGAYHYQMVNFEYTSPIWPQLGINDFYKFINSSYAFVSWEPWEQATINSFLDSYASYGVVHAPGMIMAYNGDPAMFHVYTSPVTARFSNLAFGSELQEEPAVVHLETANAVLSCRVLLQQLGVGVRGARSCGERRLPSAKCDAAGGHQRRGAARGGGERWCSSAWAWTYAVATVDRRAAPPRGRSASRRWATGSRR